MQIEALRNEERMHNIEERMYNIEERMYNIEERMYNIEERMYGIPLNKAGNQSKARKKHCDTFQAPHKYHYSIITM